MCLSFLALNSRGELIISGLVILSFECAAIREQCLGWCRDGMQSIDLPGSMLVDERCICTDIITIAQVIGNGASFCCIVDIPPDASLYLACGSNGNKLTTAACCKLPSSLAVNALQNGAETLGTLQSHRVRTELR